jgi:hypothetical protein
MSFEMLRLLRPRGSNLGVQRVYLLLLLVTLSLCYIWLLLPRCRPWPLSAGAGFAFPTVTRDVTFLSVLRVPLRYYNLDVAF